MLPTRRDELKITTDSLALLNKKGDIVSPRLRVGSAMSCLNLHCGQDTVRRPRHRPDWQLPLLSLKMLALRIFAQTKPAADHVGKSVFPQVTKLWGTQGMR